MAQNTSVIFVFVMSPGSSYENLPNIKSLNFIYITLNIQKVHGTLLEGEDGSVMSSNVLGETHAWIQKIFSVGGPNSQKGSDGKFQHGKN